MNGDPGAADVLRAKLQPVDGSHSFSVCLKLPLIISINLFPRLQILADRLVDRFTSTGLMMQEYSHVKLHVTVMNSLMRRDPTSIPLHRDQRGRDNRDRESFDATFLMKV